MIRLENVSKSFDSGRSWAVEEVYLSVEKGELVVLLGESGCGKTTTLKMINRLVEPTRGRIFVEDRDVSEINPVSLRREIGYVIQGFGLFPHLTVGENVAVVPKLLGWEGGRIAERVGELLSLVHLDPEEFRDRFPGNLSGGQQQRVGFARALAAGSHVMLMDEPFGALDPITRDELQREYLHIHRVLGLTVVMVTHDMMEALLLADRIAVMKEGKLLQVGRPRDLVNAPADEYVERLLDTPRRQAEKLNIG